MTLAPESSTNYCSSTFEHVSASALAGFSAITPLRSDVCADGETGNRARFVNEYPPGFAGSNPVRRTHQLSTIYYKEQMKKVSVRLLALCSRSSPKLTCMVRASAVPRKREIANTIYPFTSARCFYQAL